MDDYRIMNYIQKCEHKIKNLTDNILYIFIVVFISDNLQYVLSLS